MIHQSFGAGGMVTSPPPPPALIHTRDRGGTQSSSTVMPRSPAIETISIPILSLHTAYRPMQGPPEYR